VNWIEHPQPAVGDHEGVRLVAYVGHAADGRYDSPHHAVAEPQAYRVDTPAGSPPLRTHFHTVDQFQYIAWGAGKIGRHDVAAGSVHYADGFTPYGPLRAGSGGYSYLTLRPTTDMGISYMPESRGELREALERRDEGGSAGNSGGAGGSAKDRRSFTLDLRADAASSSAGWERLIDDPDGLVVAVANCPAGGVTAVPIVGGRGAYLVVVNGEVVDGMGAAVGGPGALCWCPAGSTPSVSAGPEGARVALLAFGTGAR
jgi:hypothetical protein